ncbi:MAG TPA: cytochrome c [Terriglobales bacterium]
MFEQNQEPGQATFRSSCSLCHGADGSGHTPTGKALQIPDLRSAEAQKITDDQMAEIISKGKTARMPPFGTKLDHEQIQSLVQFIRKLADSNKSAAGK